MEKLNSAALLRVALRKALKDSRHAAFLHRLHCVLLVAVGLNPTTVARWFGRAPRTIERWVQLYRSAGIPGLWDDPKSGRPPVLDEATDMKFRADLEYRPAVFGYAAETWTGVVAAEHLHRTYGCVLSVRQAQRLLRQIRSEGGNPAPSEGERVRAAYRALAPRGGGAEC